MWQGWISFIPGLWLIISGIISGIQGPGNMIIVGIITVILGFFLQRRWEGIINGILGIWLCLCAFIPGLITSPNFFITGILIVFISIIRIFHNHRSAEVKHKTA